MRYTALFPLVKLGPLGILTTIAAASAVTILGREEIPRALAAIGLLPLLSYLGYCHFRARKMVLAEQGREREIIKSSFVAIVADRAARFWGFVFAIVVIPTFTTTLTIWVYQAWLWYREGDWTSVTWLTLVSVIPKTGHTYLQRFLYWLADTNFGVLILITGLLIAAPLVTVHHKSSHTAKLRRKDLINLKKRS